MTVTFPDIDTTYSLHKSEINKFRSDGFIKLKGVFNSETLKIYSEEISKKVIELNSETRSMEKRDTYAKAFLQITNLWCKSDLVRRFVFGQRLAQIATELLGTKGVRLYHDQALYKEPGGGYTPWHVDQYYWPLSNHNAVTAWIPLQPVPEEMGPLEFSIGSQQIKFGRDFSISDESEQRISNHLKLTDLPTEASAFDLGEVSFHYGYTFHRAGPNTTSNPRRVMTIIYIDSEMRLIRPKNANQQNDLDTWMPGTEIGEIIDTSLNPILHQSTSENSESIGVL